MAKYFPLFTDIQGKNILILGGNKKAYEKVTKFSEYQAKITVISDSFCSELEQIKGAFLTKGTAEFAITYIKRCLPDMVIVADETFVNAYDVYCVCQTNRIPVNTVDKAKYSSFIVPSVMDKGNLTVAVSSSGISPTSAVKLRETIEDSLPNNLDEILEQMRVLRPILYAREDIPKSDLKYILKDIIDLAFFKERPLTKHEIQKIIDKVRETP